jgi:hypothetical protein
VLQERIPALRSELVLATLLVDERVAAVLIGHVADHREVRIALDLVVVRERNGEEQFVVLSAVQRAGRGVEVEVARGLVGAEIDGQRLLLQRVFPADDRDGPEH